MTIVTVERIAALAAELEAAEQLLMLQLRGAIKATRKQQAAQQRKVYAIRRRLAALMSVAKVANR